MSSLRGFPARADQSCRRVTEGAAPLKADRLELRRPLRKVFGSPSTSGGIEGLRHLHVSTALFLTSDSSLLQNTLKCTSNFGVWFTDALCRHLTHHRTTSSLYQHDATVTSRPYPSRHTEGDVHDSGDSWPVRPSLSH